MEKHRVELADDRKAQELGRQLDEQLEAITQEVAGEEEDFIAAAKRALQAERQAQNGAGLRLVSESCRKPEHRLARCRYVPERHRRR